MGVLESMAEGEELPPVACFDGIPAMDLLPMPITCAMQDVRQLAESAVELLLKQINGDASVSPVTVSAHVVHNRAFAKRI
jgi:DNA-binding LacI/PurR family transcriptional regulator